MSVCTVCGSPLRPDRRRPTIYCSPACRQRAYRARKALYYDGIDAPVSTEHPDEQVVSAVSLVFCQASEFRRLGRDASPRLAYRCNQVSKGLLALLEEHSRVRRHHRSRVGQDWQESASPSQGFESSAPEVML